MLIFLTFVILDDKATWSCSDVLHDSRYIRFSWLNWLFVRKTNKLFHNIIIIWLDIWHCNNCPYGQFYSHNKQTLTSTHRWRLVISREFSYFKFKVQWYLIFDTEIIWDMRIRKNKKLGNNINSFTYMMTLSSVQLSKHYTYI